MHTLESNYILIVNYDIGFGKVREWIGRQKTKQSNFVKYILSLFIQYNFYTHFYEINHITVAADEDIPIYYILLLSISFYVIL